jgi:hypothetical protein
VWLLCCASALTSLLAHEVQADARHAQNANGSAEKSTKPQPQLMPALALTRKAVARALLRCTFASLRWRTLLG